MAETLRQKQSRFAFLMAQFICRVNEMGYEVTFGDAYRDPRCPYGSERSFHHKRLAVDLNLFRDGRYLTSTNSHQPLGEVWESMGGTWGGRWNDGNHYSLDEGR